MIAEHIDVDPKNPDWCAGCTPSDCMGCGTPTIRSTAGHPADETPLWVAERKKVDDTEGGTCD